MLPILCTKLIHSNFKIIVHKSAQEIPPKVIAQTIKINSMKLVTDNQFSEPIEKIIEKISDLDWKAVYLLPSLITLLTLSFVLIIFIVLWPYGLFPIIASFLWELIEDSVKEIKDKSFSDAMPYTVAIGIYFLIYLPFFIICLPIFTIGLLGKLLSRS